MTPLTMLLISDALTPAAAKLYLASASVKPMEVREDALRQLASLYSPDQDAKEVAQ